MKLYKLTDENGITRAGESNECQWGENVSHSGTGKGELCSGAYIHAYTDPLLAVFLNPIHAAFASPRLWECDGEIAAREYDLKVGCVTLTTMIELPLPAVTTEQRVKFAILCALAVPHSGAFANWANAWLDGSDRSREAAWAARAAAGVARAARAAAWAAREAARAAAWAARAAAEAAAEAARAAQIDLAAIARTAVS